MDIASPTPHFSIEHKITTNSRDERKDMGDSLDRMNAKQLGRMLNEGCVS